MQCVNLFIILGVLYAVNALIEDHATYESPENNKDFYDNEIATNAPRPHDDGAKDVKKKPVKDQRRSENIIISLTIDEANFNDPTATIPSITIAPLQTSATSIFIPDLRICPGRHLVNGDITVADAISDKENSFAFVPEPVPPVENIIQVDHKFYTSMYIKEKDVFNEHWLNVTNNTDPMVIHPSSNVTEQSYIKRLRFNFPFFGHIVNNITVSTNGFIHTTPPIKRWPTSAQNISPFMTNFDASTSEDSAMHVYDEIDKITIVWENMTLRNRIDDKFTFAVTLYKNGDITFAYKNIPLSLKQLAENKCPAYISLADSYFISKISFYVKRKAIYSYSKINFSNYDITPNSVLKLVARPSCPIYDTCFDCANHHLKYDNFNCFWCEKLSKCSSGNDFYKPLFSVCQFGTICNLTTIPSAAQMEYSYFKNLFKLAM